MGTPTRSRGSWGWIRRLPESCHPDAQPKDPLEGSVLRSQLDGRPVWLLVLPNTAMLL
jgi:hypothetical protein